MKIFTFYVVIVVLSCCSTTSHCYDNITKNEELSEQTTTVYDTTAMDIGMTEEEGLGKAVSYPCKCEGGACSCCSGKILENFNLNMRQRLCTNLTFDPDDFTMGVKIAFNTRILYSNRINGKNPPPICLPIPRLTALRVCLRFTNIYLIGRNIHACATFEGQWNKEAAFTINFDCVRLGRDGVSLVKPEEGGGLPYPPPAPSDVDEIEEYDENDVV